MDIGIVGGGLMGMALARRLGLDGHRVQVLEAAPQLGGLATWHDFGDFFWDRFYHVILPSDRHLIQFVNDLELGDQLEWQRTYTGFYVDEQMHSISSNVEFLKFPLLSLISKMRLAWTMLYCSRIDDWQRLEKITVEEFLISVSGEETYQKLWRPLLLAKLGRNYERVSAVFIWSYIKRLFSARDKSASAENLGHVSGGYKMIFDALADQIESTGGRVETGIAVDAIKATDDSSLRVHVNGDSTQFDHVICTSPVSVLRQIVDDELVSVSNTDRDVEYLGVICPVVVSKKPLVPYYVVNIADETLPFTGVIGMSTVIDPRNTGGKYLTYLPRYILSTDDEMNKSDADVRREFEAGLYQMLPDIEADSIEAIHINRARKVQPLQVLDYSSMVPQAATQHARFHVLNTSQFVNATLNNNEVIGAVNRFYDGHWQQAAA